MSIPELIKQIKITIDIFENDKQKLLDNSLTELAYDKASQINKLKNCLLILQD